MGILQILFLCHFARWFYKGSLQFISPDVCLFWSDGRLSIEIRGDLPLLSASSFPFCLKSFFWCVLHRSYFIIYEFFFLKFWRYPTTQHFSNLFRPNIVCCLDFMFSIFGSRVRCVSLQTDSLIHNYRPMILLYTVVVCIWSFYIFFLWWIWQWTWKIQVGAGPVQGAIKVCILNSLSHWMPFRLQAQRFSVLFNFLFCFVRHVRAAFKTLVLNPVSWKMQTTIVVFANPVKSAINTIIVNLMLLLPHCSSFVITNNA